MAYWIDPSTKEVYGVCPTGQDKEEWLKVVNKTLRKMSDERNSIHRTLTVEEFFGGK